MKYYDLIIIGAGPAGLSAGIEAASHGMSVIIFDENHCPGGQLFKQIHKFFGSKEHYAKVRGFRIGQKLLTQAKNAGVTVFLDTVVVGLFLQHNVTVMKDNCIMHYGADSIIIATGASENAIPFKGWTLPGVIGAGAAQTFMNLYRETPGSNILMVGSGNVGLVVSYQLLQAGCHVTAIVDVLPRIGGYGVHAAKVARTGVPFYLSNTIVEAKGTDRVTGAVIARVGPDLKAIPGTERQLDVDTICLAVGLSPMSKLAQMAGCKMIYHGGVVPECDKYGATSVDGIFSAGDAAGIEEASSAMIEGRIAALGVAKRSGYLTEDECLPLFNRRYAELMKLRKGMFSPENQAKLSVTQTAEGYPLSINLLRHGYLTENELEVFPDRLVKKVSVHPVIECTQNIPCNPCQDVCPQNCIDIGEDITSLPVINTQKKCIGCGLCVANCPGQAIFLVESMSDNDRVTIPYEFLPFPVIGDEGNGCDRSGKAVCRVEIIAVQNILSNDHTCLVTMAVPPSMGNTVRFYKKMEG